MAVIQGGTSLALLEVGANTKAAHVQMRPNEVGALGSYIVAVLSGTMAAGLGAASTIFSCRWGDATRTMTLRRLAMVARNAGTAFSAGVFLFELMIARAFTASDSTQTAITISGNNQKRRTSFGSSLITDLRISATAAITPGTRTLDANPAQFIRGMVPATQVNYPMVGKSSTNVPGASTTAFSLDWQDLFGLDVSTEWPETFVQNEGFIIRATVPATGTWEFGVLMEWSELTATAGYN